MSQNGAGLLESLDEIIEGSGACGAFAFELFDRVGAAVVDDAGVTFFCRRRTMLAPILPKPIIPVASSALLRLSQSRFFTTLYDRFLYGLGQSGKPRL